MWLQACKVAAVGFSGVFVCLVVLSGSIWLVGRALHRTFGGKRG